MLFLVTVSVGLSKIQIGMAVPNPLRQIQEPVGATFISYGPDGTGVEVVESFGHYEAEYAAIRKGAAIFAMPERGLVEVEGTDRTEFLHRMVTNDTSTLEPGQGRRAFLLNNKGRIIADLIVLQAAERIWLDLDVFDAAQLKSELDRYLFTEDVTLCDQSAQYAHLSIHGPASLKILEAAAESAIPDFAPLAHTKVPICDSTCVVYRRDETGTPGLHVIAPVDSVESIYTRLADTVGGLVPDVDAAAGPGPKRALVGRAIGWSAYNIARIEAGTPLYHVDFGPDCLPHETGILDEAVSFTKGCYCGQEIVARMQSLGHPKRVLVGLGFADERMPIAGAQVFAQPDREEAIGVVTSSTISPMLGGRAIAFAMVKWGRHRSGTSLAVWAEGEVTSATVQMLAFL